MSLEDDLGEILTGEKFEEVVETQNWNNQRVEEAPQGREKLGKLTIVCLILNRIVGSGIFVTPAYTFNGTGSVGMSLIVWGIGGILATCGLMVWLELGLSTPILPVPGRTETQPVPRSGGEKNYVRLNHFFGVRDGVPVVLRCRCFLT
jgi:amino acid permease